MATSNDDNGSARANIGSVQALLKLRNGPKKDDDFGGNIWLSNVEHVLRGNAELENLARFLPEPPLVEREVPEVQRLLDAALDRLNTTLGPTLSESLRLAMTSAAEDAAKTAFENVGSVENVRAVLKSEVDSAIYRSTPFRLAIPLLGVVIFGGALFGTFQFRGLIQMAAQGRAEIATARDDALRQTKQDLDQRIARQNTEISLLAEQAKSKLHSVADSHLREVDGAAAAAEADFQKRAIASWAKSDSDGKLVVENRRDALLAAFNSDLAKVNSRYDEVDREFTRMQGDIPQRISVLTGKLDYLRRMDSAINILLSEKQTYDDLIASLNAAAAGRSIRAYLNWTTFGTMFAFLLSVAAFGVSILSYRRSARARVT